MKKFSLINVSRSAVLFPFVVFPLFLSTAFGAGPLEETFVRGIPCGNLLAKITLLESCQELELFFSKWEPRAERCEPLAMTLIGLKYVQNERTWQKAPPYFQRAAEQGYAPAQMELGIIFEKGLVLARDDKQAYLWYALAAAQGEERAAAGLKRMENSLSPNDLFAVRERVKNWRPVNCRPPCHFP